MPAIVVLAMPCDAGLLRALVQTTDYFKRFLHLVASPHNTHKRLHGFLQLVLNLIRVLAVRTSIERLERPLHRAIDLLFVGAHCPVGPRELRSVLASPLAEDQQTGKRISSQ